MKKNIRKKIEVSGTVQGVGFRPAVLRHAVSLELTGFVANRKSGALMEVQGALEKVEPFIEALSSSMPENCIIDKLLVNEIEPVLHENSFNILKSIETDEELYSIPPDIAVCEKCLEEFNDPSNRRYNYPFITCGDCGPRYSYVNDTPYDREKTAMSDFPMCDECLAEYNDQADRRFHIEGISCPKCGPKISGLEEGVEDLKDGKIVAVKGIGGHHLACSALNEAAVSKLREIKHRPMKGLAVMFKDAADAGEYLDLSVAEKRTLESKAAPIVLVRKNLKKHMPENLSPDNGYMGIMVAYSPLHKLILQECEFPIVLTSANVSGDPLIIDDEVMEKNNHLYDSIITHDRKIFQRADDSVLFIENGREVYVRRGRGMMPSAYDMRVNCTSRIMSLGAELKDSISIVKGNTLITGNHIGDLETEGTFSHFLETFQEMTKNYELVPEVIVCDKHPDFESVKFAQDYVSKEDCRLIQVQHHYSHFVAAYHENRLEGDTLGIVFDGTGYGDDKNIWGGEFLVGDLSSYERAGHLEYFSLPGGTASIKEPWRTLAGFLEPYEMEKLLGDELSPMFPNVQKIADNRNFSQLTSSMGRLFDAASVIAGFRGKISYEAEAAIYMDSLALESESEETVEYEIKVHDGMVLPDTGHFIKELYRLKVRGHSNENIARIFHNSVITMSCEAAGKICSERGIENVLMSGGVFQNRIILSGIEKKLASIGLRPFMNREIPACDAGISTGQAIYGALNA